MWTKKAVTILAFGVFLAFFALIFRNIQLIVASTMFLGYILVSMFTLRLGTVLPVRTISAERLFEEGDVDISLDLVNRGGRTGFIEVRDKLPRQLDLRRGSNYLLIDLRPGERKRLNYTVMAPIRGIYDIGPVTFRAQDVYGLFYKELNIEDVQKLIVFPKVEEVKDVYMKSKSMKLFPGAAPVKRPGPGSEFFLIREYVPGDPFKDINWKAYANKRKLLVNEHEREAVSDVIVVVDAREVSAYGTEGENALIFSCRGAATVANYFLKRRDSVGLMVYGERLITLKQGQGRKQLFEILTALAGAKPGGSLPFKGVVDVAAPSLPKRSPIVIFSSCTEDDSFPAAVSTLRTLEYKILIISPSSIEFEVMARMKTRSGVKETLPYDLLRLERDVLLGDIRGYGANVIVWDPKTPLLGVLAETKRFTW